MLCNLKAPTDRQELILTLAGVYLTAMDLPSGAFNPAELFDLVKADIADESNRRR